MNILMIEDDEHICEMMAMYFEMEEDWQTTFIYDGEEGWQYYKEHKDDLDMVILDLNLPGKNGLTICHDIRQENPYIPIIMLTALDNESDQVFGLETGADDYITKPFDPQTVMARMRALNRRAQLTSERLQPSQSKDNSNDYDIVTNYLRINERTREAYFNDQMIEGLTPKEFDILALLASYPRQVFSRDHLLRTLWEDPFFGDERTVDAHIKKLRQKMEKYGPQLIQTVWGVGYKLDESDVE